MSVPFLIYGSYGYTGVLIADLAVRRGMQPILSGRDAMRLKAQADSLGLEYRPIALDDRISLEVALKEVPVVLNCAGPFRRTYQPMVDACLQLGRHYLDITGEILVFESLVRRDAEARQAGVMLLPGVGFDVVPSDCLASHLKQRLQAATHLTLVVNWSGGGFSRGTALTSIEGLSSHGVERKEGKLVPVPILGKTRQIDFGSGMQTAVNIPSADVFTAYYSTGIPNIETYMVLPKSALRMAQMIRPFVGMAKNSIIRGILNRLVMKLPPGPTTEARQLGRSRLWGEVSDAQGQRVTSRMETPNGYNITAEAALGAVNRVLEGSNKPGFQTPALLFGADFILEFEGVKREDL